MIHVEILEANKRSMRPFVKLPFTLYKDDPHWVPPLIGRQIRSLCRKKTNPRRFFLVYDGDQPVARVMAGIDERLNERLGIKQGYIGLFECAPKMDYARAALDAACAFLRDEGMETVMGPSSGGIEVFTKGMLVEGFDETPVMLNAYNPAYYAEYFEKYGFKKHRDFFAYFVKMEEADGRGLEEIVPRVKQRFGFRVEHVTLRKDNQDQVLKDAVRVIREAFPPEWEMIVPTFEDASREVKNLKTIYRPETTVMAFAGNRPIGLVVAFPDYNQVLKKMRGHVLPFGWLIYLLGRKKIDGLRCNMQFVVPEYQRKAVNAAMFYEVLSGARDLGIRWGEGSVVDETSVSSIANTQLMAAHRSRTYRQYAKSLLEE